MKIPNRVKIGYKDYKVNKVEDNIIVNDSTCYGKIDFEKDSIDVSTLYSEEQQKCTFIHECLHGIDDNVETDLTENQIRKIGKGLYDFIKSNPNIFIDNETDKSGNDDITRTIWKAGEEEATTETIPVFKRKQVLSKKDIPDVARILSEILKREYNPHTQLVIDSERFRITEDVFGAPFNCKKISEIK